MSTMITFGKIDSMQAKVLEILREVYTLHCVHAGSECGGEIKIAVLAVLTTASDIGLIMSPCKWTVCSDSLEVYWATETRLVLLSASQLGNT